MSRSKQPPAAVLWASPEDTEAQFYEALRTGDLERLMAVWADDADVVCVHPGGARAVGREAIRASFEVIFAQNNVPVQTEQVRRLHVGDCAVHHLAERVAVLTDEGVQTAWALATNVYVRAGDGWRLAAHHASPGQLGEPPEPPPEWSATLH
jgi:uncharacterized protein (TIGR02246 family)